MEAGDQKFKVILGYKMRFVRPFSEGREEKKEGRRKGKNKGGQEKEELETR